ncbi:hypothetical protein CMS0349 [Clavibacter sepedonicus]|uniref:Erythromycin biosynthesis protein CIII-like C-terminal domain-containing protein n=1 Tax=Clavibacter sepedonicus TaxID=31964 RepID=B0RBR9_CLASE|nr:hypothetical protein CMS0349 [Clavibacter sepedonicus]
MIAMFVRVIPGQHRALLELLEEGRFDAVLSESAFTGVAPYVALARAERLPVLGLATTPVTLTSVDAAPFGAALPPGRGPLGHLRDRALTAAIRPGLTRPLRRAVDAVLAEIGAAPSRTDTFDFPYLCFDELFQLSVPALEYPRRELPDTVRFVGPLRAAPGSAHDTALPDWWSDLQDGRPVVHVTQGTIDNADPGRLIAPTLRALADEDVLVVATTGGRPVEELEREFGGPIPANARVAEFVSHDLLLPLCDAVVTNGGFGGVQRMLAHGLPLVVAGSTEDKPEVAARVAWAGCGRDLRTGKPRPSAIRRAMRDVLTTPSYRAQPGARHRDRRAPGCGGRHRRGAGRRGRGASGSPGGAGGAHRITGVAGVPVRTLSSAAPPRVTRCGSASGSRTRRPRAGRARGPSPSASRRRRAARPRRRARG